MLDSTDRVNEGAVCRRALATVDTFVAVVESHRLLRESLTHSIESALSVPVFSLSSISELANLSLDGASGLIILSLIEADRAVWEQTLNSLSVIRSHIKVVILASTNNEERAREAILHGVKGFIPTTMGLDIAIYVIRLVMAGGTYAPIDHLVETYQDVPQAITVARLVSALTSRETLIVNRIRQGKSNKVIAYELDMCESTVKVHVRSVMKKLHARNRTEVAMKTQPVLG